jgi:hypothetical protein
MTVCIKNSIPTISAYNHLDFHFQKK